MQLTDEFMSLGIRFIPNPPIDDYNEILDAASFATPPGHTPPNILAAVGATGTIEAEFTGPVFSVSALIGISGGSDEMEIFDAANNSLGTLVGDDVVVTLTSVTPIARFIIRPFNSTTPAVDNLTFDSIGGGSVGTPFCSPANSNSTGVPALLTGSNGSGVGSDLHLEITGGVPGQLAYFLVGNEATQGISVSNGQFCLAGTTTAQFFRFNVGGTDMNSIGGFNANGTMINAAGTSTTGFGFDVPTTIPSSPPTTIMAGQTWHFQGWYRDTPAGVGSSNFTNGLSVTF